MGVVPPLVVAHVRHEDFVERRQALDDQPHLMVHGSVVCLAWDEPATHAKDCAHWCYKASCLGAFDVGCELRVVAHGFRAEHAHGKIPNLVGDVLLLVLCLDLAPQRLDLLLLVAPFPHEIGFHHVGEDVRKYMASDAQIKCM